VIRDDDDDDDDDDDNKNNNNNICSQPSSIKHLHSDREILDSDVVK
jgi:hypothetical protein